MNTREVLTLQFGHHSNFVGTHWWNIQESSFNYNNEDPSEINHDVLFREGLTPKGQVTFTPRLLLVDLKGSLKSLPEIGCLYDPLPEPSKAETNWEHDVEVQAKEPEQKIEFQNELSSIKQPTKVLNKSFELEKDVKVWSDFLYSQFHSRTVNILKEYELNNGTTEFNAFPLGTNLWKSEQFSDGFSDKIRNYIEECDSFQGFHVLLDAMNAFSGLGTSCIEHLRDEYDTKSILTFPTIPSYYSDYFYKTDEERLQSLLSDAVRVINIALCFNALTENSSLFTPICTGSTGWRQPGPKREFYHVQYDQKLWYHSSAILASSLDTITLSHRLRSSNYALSDLCADFNTHGRKASAASICLPFSFNKGADFIDCLDNWEGPLTQSITPNCSIGTDKVNQILTLRGIPESRLKRPLKQAGNQKNMPAYNCNSVKEMLNFYLSCNYFLTVSEVTTCREGLSVKTPYPNIFDEFVSIDGNIAAESRPNKLVIESVPVLAGLHSSASVGDMLENLHTEAKRIKFPRFHQFISAGLESDEFTECLDRLFDLRECYEENYNI